MTLRYWSMYSSREPLSHSGRAVFAVDSKLRLSLHPATIKITAPRCRRVGVRPWSSRRPHKNICMEKGKKIRWRYARREWKRERERIHDYVLSVSSELSKNKPPAYREKNGKGDEEEKGRYLYEIIKIAKTRRPFFQYIHSQRSYNTINSYSVIWKPLYET